MPPAIGAAVAAVGLTGFAASVATTVLNAAFSFGLSAVFNKVFAKKEKGFESEVRDRTIVVRSNVAARSMIYGQVMTSGPLVFAGTDGAQKQHLYLVIPLADHEVEEIGEVFLDDRPASHRRYEDHVRVWRHTGSVDQAANARLTAVFPGWTSNDRARGVAYIVVRLLWDKEQKVFPNGIPNIKALVKGKRVWDPRDLDQLENVSSTWKYSNNMALCVRDWMASKEGIGALPEELDIDQFIAEANICDEDVQLTGVTTQKRYTCDGEISYDEIRAQVMEKFLTSCAGDLVYTEGVYKFYVGAYREPEFQINEDNLRGALKIRPRVERSKLANKIRGTFVDPNQKWQPNDIPPVSNALYKEADGGRDIETNVDLAFITNSTRAQRILKILLNRTRLGSALFPAKFNAMDAAVRENLGVTIDLAGWNGKVMMPTKFALSDAGIDLDLEDTVPDLYAWNFGEATVIDPADDVDLEPASEVATPGAPLIIEDLFETKIGLRSRVIVTTAGSSDAFAESYKFEYREVGAVEWLSLPLVEATRAEIVDPPKGLYDFRLRATNSIGVKSEYAVVRQRLFGLMAPPRAVTGLSIAAIGGMAHLRWDPHPDLDVVADGVFEFRHSPFVTGASPNNSVTIGRAVAGNATSATLPLKRGTYIVFARDSSRVRSRLAAMVSTTAATLLNYGPLDSIQEEPGFVGVKSNCVVDGSRLKLGSIANVDSVSDFDAIENIDTLGGIVSIGVYDFSAKIDNGTVKPTRLETELAVLADPLNDQFDDRLTSIDQWEGFDSLVSTDIDADIYVRTTDDDPNGVPIWSDWHLLDVGEFNTRAFEFQLRLTTGSADVNILIDRARVIASEVL